MTDRISSFLVTLDHDIREDDVETIASAVSMVKGVLNVDWNVSDDWEQSVGETRERAKIRKVLLDLLKEL